MRHPQASSVWRNATGLPMPQKAATGCPRTASSGISAPAAEISLRGAWITSAPTACGAYWRMVGHRAARRGIEQIGAGEDHHVGPPQPFDRFPQPSPRKHVAEPERLQGIQEHDVQIAAEAAMLKTVVQHDQVRSEGGNGLPCGGHAVGVLQVRHVGERLLQFAGLVVGLARRGPITTANHRHTNAAVGEPAAEPADQGRLAGAAEGQVADADHRHADAVNRRPTVVVAAVPPAYGGRIERFSDAEHAAQRAGPDAAPPAAKDLLEFRCTEQVAILALTL